MVDSTIKVIIAGSRTITDYTLVAQTIDAACQEWQIPIGAVVSGGAQGVDECGERWAKEHGIPLLVISAQWQQYGRAAGPRRNLEMASMAKGLIAVWDGKSRGTKHMIDVATAYGLRVFVRQPAELAPRLF